MNAFVKKVNNLVLLSFITGLFLTGCGESEVTGETGKVIAADGSVKATIVRDFDESLYSVSELEDMMNSEAADYNSSNGAGNVSVVSVECVDNKVTAVMDYKSDRDYSSFNSRYFTRESCDEAIANGSLRVSMKDVSSLEGVDISSITGSDKLDVLVTDEVGYLTLPGKVRYISDGVEVVTKKQVLVSDNMDGLAYIIFSRK